MSTSRLEKFIYAICSMEVSDLPAPLSRIEILWNCLITGETPDFEPQSRNEQYLMAMLGLYELENLPTPMSRGEKLLYKIAMGETDLSDIPAYLSRYEELLGYLAENGGVGDFEYILQTLNQRLSTLYSTKEQPMKQAVVKGDTLVNELPRPSLKNTMTNVASQKLNQGYDNGKTLVNLVKNSDIVFKKTPGDQFGGIYPSNIRSMIERVNNINPNKKYLIKMLSDTKQVFIRFFNDSSNTPTGNTSWINSNTIFTTGSDTSKINLSFRLSENNEEYTDISQCSNILLLEYQDGMENWDIPYFEGTKTFSATLNVVDGEFKQAVVKGQTLVNLIPNTTISWACTNSSGWLYKYVKLNQQLKPNTIYTIIANVLETNGDKTFSLVIGGKTEAAFRSKSVNIKKGRNVFTAETYSDGQGNLNFVFFQIQDKYIGNFTLNDFIILEGDYTNVDIPYFEGMQSVQLSEVTTTGKNLFDGKLENGAIISGTGINAPSTDNVRSIGYIKVNPNASIVVSNDLNYANEIIYEYDANKQYIGRKISNPFTTSINCHYIRFRSGTNQPNLNVKYQLEYGSIATPYEPYHLNTLTLAEPVTLRKVSDIQDEFDALTGQVTERVGEVVLNGSEQWYLGTTKELTQVFGLEVRDMAFIDNKINCDKLPVNASGDAEKVASWYKSNNEQYTYCLYMALFKTKVSTVDGLKTYLSQNPITVQYQLKTESTKTINTTITDQDGATQTKLHSFNDGHLSVSSQGLFPSINYEVPTNNSYYLPDRLTLGAQYTSRGSADCNATIDGKLLVLGKNRTFTTPSTLMNRLMVLDAPVDDLMFIKGDQTAKDFGYFEGMKSVALSNKMPVLTTTGKNLFDGEIEEGIFDSNGNPSNYVGRTRSKNFIKVPKNTDLYISIGGASNASWTTIYFYNDKKEYTETINTKDANKTFNTGNNSYIKWKNNSPMSQITNIQIEQGSVATPYEPYKTNILTVNEPVELRGIGDTQDTLDCLTGEVVERIGEIVLDGKDKLVGKYDKVGDTIGFYFNDNIITPKELETSEIVRTCICDNFKVDIHDRQWSEWWLDDEFISIAQDGRIGLRLLSSKASTLEEANRYLVENPIRLQYQLKNESTKTVDLTTVDQDGQPTKLKTFNDISYVEIDADNIIPSVNIEVATKINETLATLDPQQLDISETQNELGQTIEEQTENTDATMMATTEIYEQIL